MPIETPARRPPRSVFLSGLRIAGGGLAFAGAIVLVLYLVEFVH